METDVYTLAHEIKNPLTIAKGYLEMSNETNFLKYKELINNNILEALNILDSYLEYNKLSLDKDILDIVMMMEEIKDDCKVLFNIEINIITIYEELFIKADYHKLKQVFNNLLKNSVEAHSNKIDISIKAIDDELLVRLIDNGDGFDNLDNLEGHSSKINGHGIGLMITNKIIDLHDGIIKYENNDDGGANILIKLPIKL